MPPGSNPYQLTEVEVDEVTFHVAPITGLHGDDKLIILKDVEILDRYEELFSKYEAPRMVELGIMYGGSMAFFVLRAKPAKIVGFELSEARRVVLDDFIRDRGLGDAVRPYYGVNQADADRLREIIAEEVAGAPLDLVVDDASHLYGPSKASFNVLFPLLRPGGEYVIEDWSFDHTVRSAYLKALDEPDSILHPWAVQSKEAMERDGYVEGGSLDRVSWSLGHLPDYQVPLSKLGHQLIIAASEGIGGVREVRMDTQWIVVTRNDDELDADSYDIDAYSCDHFGVLSGR